MNYKFVKRQNSIGWDWYLELDDCSSWVSQPVKYVIESLESENAKLRELVRALNWCTENFWCLDSPSNCDDCPLEQSDKLAPECEVRMRELGIEVEL